MKKLVVAIAAVVVCGSLFANGNQITWKGGGDTPRWSDGSNWEGGVAPEKGDIAVIPEDTTAYASHYTDERGDITFINALGGIHLAGTNAVFELDDELDPSGTISLTTPLSGNGQFIFENTVQNDRGLNLSGDNSAFTGWFRFLYSRVYVYNQKGLGVSGNPIEFKPSNGQHSILYRTSGVYSNDVYITGSISGSGPSISGSGGCSYSSCTNLGYVVAVASGGSATLGSMYFHGVSNLTTSASSIRLGNGAVVGTGGLSGLFRATKSTFYILGPLTRCGDGYNFCLLGEDGGGDTVVCWADNVLNAASFKMANGTLDLNGHSQGGMRMNDFSNSSITSAVPASVTWTGAYGSGDGASPLSVDGKATLIVQGATATHTLTLKSRTASTKGGLEVKKGKLAIASDYSLPNVRRLASLGDKYNLSTLVVNTANVNPGRVDIESANDSAKFEIADGVQLDVRTFKSAGKYVKEGVYGSAAAQEAGTVDADHVLPCLAGLGTVKVELDGPPGLMLLVR